MTFKCSYCGIQKINFRKYTHHLSIFHEADPGFFVTCNINNCKDTYCKVRGLVRHVAQKHKDITSNRNAAVNMLESDGNDMEMESMEVDNNSFTCEDDSSEDLQPLYNKKNLDNFRKHFAQSILKIKEKHILCSTLQTKNTESMKFLVEYQHDIYRSLVADLCSENGIQIGPESIYHQLVSENSLLGEFISEFETEHRLTKFLIDNSMHVKPREILLGRDNDGKKVVYHNVPVTDVLKLILSNDEVREHIHSQSRSETSIEILKDFTDGSILC